MVKLVLPLSPSIKIVQSNRFPTFSLTKWAQHPSVFRFATTRSFSGQNYFWLLAAMVCTPTIAAPEIVVPATFKDAIHPFIDNIHALFELSYYVIALSGGLSFLYGLICLSKSSEQPLGPYKGRALWSFVYASGCVAFVDTLEVTQGTLWGNNDVSVLSFDYPYASTPTENLSLVVLGVALVLKFLGVCAIHHGLSLSRTLGEDRQPEEGRAHQIFAFLTGGGLCLNVFRSINFALSFWGFQIRW